MKHPLFLPLMLLPMSGIGLGSVSMEPVIIDETPSHLDPQPAPPSLGTGLGSSGGPVEAFSAYFYQFSPEQEAARDTFHENLLRMPPAAARRELPPGIAHHPILRCDAPCIRLREKGLWLAHFRERVVAPSTGRFRFHARGDARVSVLFKRQRVLDKGVSETFHVTEGHSYPVEIIISGGETCTLLIEDLDGNAQADREEPRYDLFRCSSRASAPEDTPCAEDAPVWLLERYLKFVLGLEPVRE